MKNEKSLSGTFLEMALSETARILSLQDRNPISPTYGSFDREYWFYKKTDTPYASVQGAVFSLALLYKNKLPGNVYYGNRKVLDWVIAGLRFWAKIQNKNGSFDEYYPHEKSYIGTALGLYPCAEAFLLVKNKISEADKKIIIDAFDKACNFLSKNKEPFVINQETMAALAIYTANHAIRKSRYANIAKNKISFIIKQQDKEGWFPEYGGCDVGYLSYTIDFLASYYNKSRDKRVLGPLHKAIEFISYFLHPDGTAGGEYTARNTEYLVPHGFALVNDKLSSRIVEFAEDSLGKGSVSLMCLDNRYLPLYAHQYIQTSLDYNGSKSSKIKLPYERKNFDKFFENAGILVKKIKDFYIIIGTSKGGVIRVYDCKNGKIIYSDCGYIAFADKIGSSAYLDHNRHVSVKGDKVIIKGKFYKQKQLVSTKYKHMALRVALTGGVLSKPLREAIKRSLITKKSLMPINFSRTFNLSNLKDGKIAIEDEILHKNKIKKLMLIDKFSFRYIPSSRFFQTQELNTFGTKIFNRLDKLGKRIRIEHSLELKSRKVTTKLVR